MVVLEGQRGGRKITKWRIVVFVYNKQKEIKMSRAGRGRDGESGGETGELEEKLANTPRDDEQEGQEERWKER